MKKKIKRRLAILLTVVVAVMAVTMGLQDDAFDVKAATTEYDVNTVAAMVNAFKACTEASDFYVQLEGDLVISDTDLSSGSVFELTAGNLTVDLNNHTIDASACTSSGTIFLNSGGTLTITDSSELGSGRIISPPGGVIVRSEGGTLNILKDSVSAGSFSFEDAAQCLSVQNTTVNITGGCFETDKNGSTDCALLMTGDTTDVTISGGIFESAYGTIFVQNTVTTGKSSLTITGGAFTASENGSYSYACYLGGACKLAISGGTFNLGASGGSSLVIGTSVTDDMVSISGGTYNGRIARMISSDTDWDYTTYYGTGTSGGILADGCVLTDNTLNDSNGQPTVFTVDTVRVVPGYLVKFYTQRSRVENYDDADGYDYISANAADYSLLPVSVGTDGQIYENSGCDMIPQIDTTRVLDGNIYSFYGWNYGYAPAPKIYASLAEYVEDVKNSEAQTNITLDAYWSAKVSSATGLASALEKGVVRAIEVTEDISTDTCLSDNEEQITTAKILDLGGHTISSNDTENPAILLMGYWNIKNGTIESMDQPCIQLYGAAIIQDLKCRAQNADYAIGFPAPNYMSVESKILSGTFETTKSDGYALQVESEMGTAEELTDLWKGEEDQEGPYVSSSQVTITDSAVSLSAPKLLVSQTPITYIGNGSDVDMGSYAYGDAIPAMNQSISNENFMGDIVVTGISVDDPAFTVTGESASKTLVGGSTDTYSYIIKAAGTPVPGSYEGTVSAAYTKMDGSAGTYQQKVAMTVTEKQLTIAEPTIIKEKTYDGTATAKVTAGALQGVVNGDDVSVAAAAVYENAGAGNGKKITVTYTLSGADKDKYLVPAAVSYTDGIINKADGTASVTMADYYVGEMVKPEPKVVSATNGTETVTFYYKQKGAADDTYTTTAPTEAGRYTLKAVFAATDNYNAIEVTADFEVTYIAAPDQPYTLSGTQGSNGWYTTAVTITPADGYLISNEKNGTWQDSYTMESTAEPVIYLKDENGAVTEAIQVKKIFIDTEAPVITGITDGETYQGVTQKAVITDDNLWKVTLNGVDVSFVGTSAEVSLEPAEGEYVITAEDKAGNTVQYTIRVENTGSEDTESGIGESILFGGIRSLLRGKAYRFDTGQWTVSGDATVYNGGMNFYVSADGEYNFSKK